jgi:hypothetical protein
MSTRASYSGRNQAHDKMIGPFMADYQHVHGHGHQLFYAAEGLLDITPFTLLSCVLDP